ncbi:MAG: glycosyltransferase family 4 protein [Sedimentisphaerales bacterium]|nr:glycosyltransferase family 4 protein [Sedimentisphaerales bacterium]
MKVLMLGWEFPPFISGGLGTACYGLTRAMSRLGTQITFVLPRPVTSQYASHVKMAGPSASGKISASELFESGEFSNVEFRTIDSLIQPYQTDLSYDELLRQMGKSLGLKEDAIKELLIASKLGLSANYGENLYQEVQRYARLATLIARTEHFDVIHAHDWMTYPAGIAISAMTGKPLIVHIHSTEFDRSGEHVNQMVYDIERQGMHYATKVIAVSHLTKNIVVNRYAVSPDKVKVVYNAVERNGSFMDATQMAIKKHEKIVLFLGRITMQKGPEYFLAAAKKVLEVMDDVKFVMAGSGDMVRRTIEMAAEMGIGHKVLFTGFLHGDDVDKIFRMADLFVMPSVSEPFGLVPLEALRNDVPVIISKQSGVAEVLTHALKVDFWDINEIANKIIAVLRHPPLSTTLKEHGNFEVRKLNWDNSARQCLEIYSSTMQPAPV